jgi:hypothetical protein
VSCIAVLENLAEEIRLKHIGQLRANPRDDEDDMLVLVACLTKKEILVYLK